MIGSDPSRGKLKQKNRINACICGQVLGFSLSARARADGLTMYLTGYEFLNSIQFNAYFGLPPDATGGNGKGDGITPLDHAIVEFTDDETKEPCITPINDDVLAGFYKPAVKPVSGPLDMTQMNPVLKIYNGETPVFTFYSGSVYTDSSGTAWTSVDQKTDPFETHFLSLYEKYCKIPR
jgi:hypothetical protein